jgi:hypothetical protein
MKEHGSIPVVMLALAVTAWNRLFQLGCTLILLRHL